MNLLARFTALFIALIAALGAVFWFSHRNASEAADAALQDSRRERQQRLLASIALQGRGLESMVSSYAWWNDMVKFMEKPDPAWASKTVDNIVGIPSGGDAVWIVDPSFQLVHCIDSNYARPALPFARGEQMQQFTTARFTFNYFTLIDGKLWQIFGAAIQSADFWRHETPVRGYLLLGKQWDDAWLAQLSTIAGARITLDPTGSAVPTEAQRTTLRGLDDQPLIELDAQFNFQVVRDALRDFYYQLGLIAAATLVAFAAIGLVLGLIVLRPLGRITRSLESRTPTPLGPLVRSRTEFGEIARLVAGQLRWGRMLQDEMRRQIESADPARIRRDAESNEALRLRLSSDIHDGPIQSIYAAGLQLAAIQAAAEQGASPRPEQVAAINGMLQQASSDLRNLILDLEPDELREHDLETALERLERHMAQAGRCQFELRITDNALDGLTRAAQTELYFICRELASNALRHARPNTASLTLALADGFLRLVWQNNGVSPQAALAHPGNGLRNIERRVSDLGGTAQLGPDGGEGWRAVCEIPLTSLTVTTPSLQS
jgi:signal transduction histidine kinase